MCELGCVRKKYMGLSFFWEKVAKHPRNCFCQPLKMLWKQQNSDFKETMGKNSNPTMFALVFLNLIAQSFGRILREQGGSPIPTTTKQAYPPMGCC